MSSNFLMRGPAAPGPIETGGNGRVHTRYNAKRGYHRFGFRPVYPDQAETILEALALARDAFGTTYDAVALDNICIHFLGTFDGPPAINIENDEIEQP